MEVATKEEMLKMNSTACFAKMANLNLMFKYTSLVSETNI